MTNNVTSGLITYNKKQLMELKIQYMETQLVFYQKEIQRTGEYGDLKENSEHEAARNDAKRCQDDINKLRNLISFPIYTYHSKKIVDFGATLTLEKKGRTRTFLILGVHEADIDHNIISTESPFARQILGKHIGEKVIIKNNNWTINKIEYTDLNDLYESEILELKHLLDKSITSGL